MKTSTAFSIMLSKLLTCLVLY